MPNYYYCYFVPMDPRQFEAAMALQEHWREQSTKTKDLAAVETRQMDPWRAMVGAVDRREFALGVVIVGGQRDSRVRWSEVVVAVGVVVRRVLVEEVVG
jgi:hypothetical protein